MSGPVLIPPRAGEVVGDAPDRRVEILSDLESLSATWSRFGPGREGADLHIHRRHTDLFYVLEGELTLRLGLEDERVTLPAGALARMPPFVVHGFRNGSDGEVRYLNLHAPGRQFADYLRAMRDGVAFTYDQEPPPAEGVRPASEAAIAAAADPGLPVAVLADEAAITVAEVREGPPPPAREDGPHAESLYVLEGELAIEAGGRALRATAGTWAQVPPGEPHTVTAAGAARYLVIRTPGVGVAA